MQRKNGTKIKPLKKAIIVGHTGQDGTYLRQLLEDKYEVVGLNTKSELSILDLQGIEKLTLEFKPDEIYYLAAFHQSSQDGKIDDNELFKKSFDVNVLGVLNFLSCIKKNSPSTKFFYASSSHVFGDPFILEQTELSPINPTCIYGMTKATGMNMCKYFRDNYGLFISIGILYNHESPLRSSKFIINKIIKSAINIISKKSNTLEVGNINSAVDWGYAPDYVDAIYKIMQLNYSDNFIIATQKTHTIKEVLEIVFNLFGLDWKKYTTINQEIIRKTTKTNLRGNYNKLFDATGWTPTVGFKEMLELLIDEEVKKQTSKT